MKKLCYQVEETNSIPYIVFFLFCILCLVISILASMFTGESMFPGVVGIILFAVFIYIILFIDDKSKEKDRKELNNIKEKGIKVEGTLVKFNRYITNFRSSKHLRSYYTLIVEYINPYTNEVIQYETPVLSFDAHHYLGSKKCSVYILNDKIYVTDFVKVNKGEENIWAQEDGKYREIANLKRKEISKLILRIILFILLWLGIVIWAFFFW